MWHSNGDPGGILVKLVLKPSSKGKSRELCQMVYVVVGAEELIVCKSALNDLGLLNMTMGVKGKKARMKKGIALRAMDRMAAAEKLAIVMINVEKALAERDAAAERAIAANLVIVKIKVEKAIAERNIAEKVATARKNVEKTITERDAVEKAAESLM